MKHLDLFSGIGGFALAAQWLDIETVAFCEIEEFAQKVLNKNFPHIPIHTDVRKTDEFIQYRDKIDILTGGYPCQPFSVAGKQKAEEDPRHLWPSMFEIIKLVRPTWVLAENVAGHIKLGLDKVLLNLENEGYSARAVVIPALAVNAPHERKRVWIIAHSQSEQSSGRVQRESSQEKQGELRGGSKQSITSHPCSERLQGQRFDRGPMYTTTTRNRKISGVKHDDKFQNSWVETATKLCRVDDGVPDWVDRNKGLGNAIVPQVAYEIMKAMIKQ